MKPERVEAIYNELELLVIELDGDPSSKGPVFLQDLISKTRGYLNKTSLLIHEVHREHHILERELTALEAAFELGSDELLANDNRVTRLPNIDDRKAMINLLLREDKVKIQDLKRKIKELTFVEKAVKHRHKELDNTMSGIRMQKSLIDSELRTGSFYGDESNTSRNSIHKMNDDIDEAELSKLLGEDLTTTTEPAQAVEDDTIGFDEDPQAVGVPAKAKPIVEEVKETEEEKEVQRFLEGDDYSDILSSL